MVGNVVLGIDVFVNGTDLTIILVGNNIVIFITNFENEERNVERISFLAVVSVSFTDNEP